MIFRFFHFSCSRVPSQHFHFCCCSFPSHITQKTLPVKVEKKNDLITCSQLCSFVLFFRYHTDLFMMKLNFVDNLLKIHTCVFVAAINNMRYARKKSAVIWGSNEYFSDIIIYLWEENIDNLRKLSIVHETMATMTSQLWRTHSTTDDTH